MDGAAHHAAGGGGQLAQVLLLLVLHIKVSLSRFVNTITRETARLESYLRRSGQSALRGQLGEILGLGPLLAAARAGLRARQLVGELQSPHQHPPFIRIKCKSVTAFDWHVM